jgi:hypothetical protein
MIRFARALKVSFSGEEASEKGCRMSGGSFRHPPEVKAD